MTARGWRLGLLTVVGLVQLSAPASLIWRHERALSHGTRHLIRCVSRDPVDWFRGRYLQLNLDAMASGVERSDLQPGRVYFGELRLMEDGFTRIVALHPEPPAGEYVKLRTGRFSVLDLPFDRYYLKESVAPRVDEIFMHDLREGRIEAVLAVRVLDGTATLEELLLDGEPVADYIRRQPLRPREVRPVSPED